MGSASLALVLILAAGGGDPEVALRECRLVDDVLERLACYDAIALPEPGIKVMRATTAPGGDVVVPSPMQLDLQLPTDYLKAKSQPPPQGLDYVAPVKASWHSTEQRRFVCDEARIPHVWMKRVGGRGEDGELLYSLEAGLIVITEWFRQEVFVDLSLVVDDIEVRRERWDGITIGDDDTAGLAYAGGASRQLTVPWPVTLEELKTWFRPESEAVLRILLTIPE